MSQDSGVNETQMKPADRLQSLPKKWNAIVGSNGPEEQKECPAPNLQPNRRERSESLPCIKDCPVIEETEASMMFVPVVNTMKKAEPVGGDDELSNNLYKALWRTLDGSMATSPVRSPVVADWKVVGSPSGSLQKLNDPLDQLAEDEARLREGSGSLSGISSVDRNRRLRSASVIGELLHSGVSDLFQSSTGSPVNSEASEKRSGGGCEGQVAQLPTMLHDELGVENDADATEIFKRSSMESVLDDGEDTDPYGEGSRRAELFKNMTFGPVGSLFSGPSTGPLSALPTGSMERRRPSYLGLTDWPLSAGAVGTGRPDSLFVEEVNLDDYFSSNSLRGPWNISGNGAGGSGSSSQRLSRRHSLVAPEGVSLEEHFGQMGFGSVPKGSSPPRHYGGGYAGHASYAGGAELEYEMYGHGMHGGYGHGNGHGPSSHGHLNTSEPPFQLSSYNGPLWAIEFKSGRTEIFYVLEVDGEPQVRCTVGDLVIVEADRGEDLGRITAEISVARMRSCISGNGDTTSSVSDDKNEISAELAALLRSKEIIPKRIHRLALPQDMKLLQAKAQEEALAMVRCQSRIRQKKLPMEVVDAEYQWDRNKLTFYFVADRRIDFRELVRDLFRIYKTRIWMCAVDKTSPRMVNYLGGLVPVHSSAIEEEEDLDGPIPVSVGTTATAPSTISYKSVTSQTH